MEIYEITIIFGAIFLLAFLYVNKSDNKAVSVPPTQTRNTNVQEYAEEKIKEELDSPDLQKELPKEVDPPEAKEHISEGMKKMTILFATQSGNSLRLAEELSKEAKSYKFHARVYDLETYDFMNKLSKENFVVLLISTYGDGDPTDSSRNFDDWIMSQDREGVELKNLEFSVFGLGNRQYEFFNMMGRKLDARFEALGAKRIFERGEGDDDGSLEDDWNKWKTAFWPAAMKHFHGDAFSATEIQLPTFTPNFCLVIGDIADDDDDKELSVPSRVNLRRSSTTINSSLDSKTFDAMVRVNRELRNMSADPKKLAVTTSTFHLELEISDEDLSYRTADNLGIFPRNDLKLVSRLAKRLGVDLKQFFHLKHVSAETSSLRNPIEEPITVQDALLWKIDISTQPRKKFLEIMAQFCSDEVARREINCLFSDQAAYDKLVEERCNVVDLLERFPQVNMPFEVFLEVASKLQPRYFTISSSNLVHPRVIHITVTLVEEHTTGKVFNGVCSTYLKNLKPGKDVVRCFLRKSTFELPRDPTLPVILVGPGTGIAPMRAFIQEGFFLKNKGSPPVNWSLYFGCRHKNVDYIYEEELKKALDEGILGRLELACSRDQPEKVYVQHLLKQQGEFVWDVVHRKGGHVYVCGGTSMGRDVRNLIMEISQEKGGLTQEQASAYLRDLQTSGRFVQELWG